MKHGTLFVYADPIATGSLIRLAEGGGDDAGGAPEGVLRAWAARVSDVDATRAAMAEALGPSLDAGGRSRLDTPELVERLRGALGELLTGEASPWEARSTPPPLSQGPRGPAAPQPEGPPSERSLFGLADLAAATDEVLARARRTVQVFDADLGPEWNSRARIDALRHFLVADRNNRLCVVLHDCGRLSREFPRLLTLLRDYGHLMAIHETEAQAKAIYDPVVVADGLHGVHRFHYEDNRGLLIMDNPEAVRPLVERFDEVWAASRPSSEATSLSL